MKINLMSASLIVALSISTTFAKIEQKKSSHSTSLKSIESEARIKKVLLSQFSKNLDKKSLVSLKKEVFSYSGKSVPSLIEVMKSSKYPDKNRWIATFLLGRIVGKKSSPFLAKFIDHPSWVLRMASLKTLLALKEDRYGLYYAKSLKDNSFLVRKQALENIRKLNLKKYAANVWSMLYDKKNYYQAKDKKELKAKKRTNLIKDAVKVVGDLKFEKALQPLLTMVQKDRYQDIFDEMDYSLQKITGKKSPNTGLSSKKRFWKKVGITYKTF
tara:strand:+ start:31519 stop:32331 length:813 start_codon:yes stop_codon:yes gene_type:complete